MAASETVSSAPTSAGRPFPGRALGRLAGVAVTVAVTLAVWGVGRLAGADYVLRDPSGAVAIDALTTAVVTLVVSLLGWGTLVVLERLTPVGTRVWAALAAAVVVASMIPIFLVDATPGTGIALFFVHLAAAALIPALLRTR